MLNDLWEFNPTSSMWRLLLANGPIPSPRCGHTCCILRDHLIIHGGFYRKNVLGDLLALSLVPYTRGLSSYISRILGPIIYQRSCEGIQVE